MYKQEEDLEIERVRELFHYNVDNGQLRWGIRASGVPYGEIAGNLNNIGYRVVSINRKRFGAHRLAHAMFYGWWPNGDIDHINGIRDDNSIDNLRDATNSQNAANSKLHNRNKSGFRGVSWSESRKKWCAQICKGGISKNLGRFDTPEAAHAAYLKAAKELFGEYARMPESAA